MTSIHRFRNTGTALAHPLSRSAWRDAFIVRPADAIFTTAIKVGIAATLVLIAGGLLGQPQLAGMAALGALTSAFGRYQPYRRLGRMMAIVGAGMVLAMVIGTFLGAAAVPMMIQIVVLSVLAGLAAHVFLAFRISGPGAVILVFAASAGSGNTHSYAGMLWPIVAIIIGIVVGWLAAMAPVLWVPLAPSRLAAARAIANILRLEADDAGPLRAAAKASLRSARESVTVSAGTLRTSNSRSVRLHQNAAQLHLLLDEAEAALGLLESSTDGSYTEAFSRLARHESELRKIHGIPTVSAPTNPAVPSAHSTRNLVPKGFVEAATAELTARTSVHQALRMAAAAALSGWAAVGLGLEHSLWATMGAIAALQGLSYAATVQRSIQRLVGNVLGAIVAVGILSLALDFWPSVVLVIIFQVLAELLVLKNYILTTIAVTPMALIMTGLGTNLGPDAALSRVADTLVGVVIGTIVAAVSISRSDRQHISAGTSGSKQS